MYLCVICCSTRTNDPSDTHWWFSHQSSWLIGKVTNLLKAWFVHYTYTHIANCLPFFSSRERERGGWRWVIHGHSVTETKATGRTPCSFLYCRQLPLPPLTHLTYIAEGGQANIQFTIAPSDRWGRRGLRCHWLTAGESAMRIGGCRGTGMKTCVRRRWCWWKNCASTPQEATAKVNAARSSATCWEVATDRTQVTQLTHLETLLHLFYKVCSQRIQQFVTITRFSPARFYRIYSEAKLWARC